MSKGQRKHLIAMLESPLLRVRLGRIRHATSYELFKAHFPLLAVLAEAKR